MLEIYNIGITLLSLQIIFKASVISDFYNQPCGEGIRILPTLQLGPLKFRKGKCLTYPSHICM